MSASVPNRRRVLPAFSVQRPPRLLLRPEAVAEALDISRAKVCQLIASGELPSICIGRSRRVPLDALGRWIDERLGSGTP